MLNPRNTNVDNARSFADQLDNLQLNLSNECNSLVDATDKDCGRTATDGFNSSERHAETASTSSPEVSQVGAVITTVADVHAASTPTLPSSSSTSSSMPDHQASSSRRIAFSGNMNEVICPTEARSGAAFCSNTFQQVADYASKPISSAVQRKKDAATQSHRPVTCLGGSASIPSETTHLPQLSVTGQPTRDVATQSSQQVSLNRTSKRSKKHRKQPFKPPCEPYTSVPMPYWYIPPPASSATCQGYADPHVPCPMLLPTYSMAGPASVSAPVSTATTTKSGKPPALSHLLPSSESSYTATTLHPPFIPNPGRKAVIPGNSSDATETAEKFKEFYITPFAPSTTADQVSNYISKKTGWTEASFRCQSLMPAARRRHPASFVSFKVSILDNPAFTNTITKYGFWPSFVNVTPFEQRTRK